MIKDNYSYWLTVEGSEEDRKAVYDKLAEIGVIGTELELSLDEPKFSSYSVPEKYGSISEWNEDEIDDVFHAAAMAAPNATLHLEGCNEDDKLTRFQKRFHGDKFQETRTVTTMPPLQEGYDVPFADRQKLREKPLHRKVFLLCEEMENNDAVRTFDVLAVSEDKEALRQLLRAKVSKDDEGIIAENGVNEDSPDYFTSHFDNGRIVVYYILEENIKTREQAIALLQTRSFSDTFIFPDNLRNWILSAVKEYAQAENYGKIDCEKVAAEIMEDRSFRSELKQGFWYDENYISDKHESRAMSLCSCFLSDMIHENPDLFTDIGAAPAIVCPDNLKDIIVDNIYDIAKMLHLPVQNAYEQAKKIMRNVQFKEAVANLCDGLARLEPGTEVYHMVSALCLTRVVEEMGKSDVQETKTNDKATRLDSLIKQAEERAGSNGAGSPGPIKSPVR